MTTFPTLAKLKAAIEATDNMKCVKAILAAKAEQGEQDIVSPPVIQREGYIGATKGMGRSEYRGWLQSNWISEVRGSRE